MTKPSARRSPALSRSERRTRAFAALAAAAAALACWEALSRSGAYSPHLFPPPSAALRALGGMARSGELGADLAASGRRWGAGLALGIALGAVLGLLTGGWRPARRFLSPLFHFVRSTPFLVLLPLALLWFGIGELSKIAIVAWGAFFPVWLSAEAAALAIDPEQVWTARSLGASGPRLWREVHWKACLPGVVTGARLAVSTAVFALGAAEMAGAFEGVAFRVFYSHQMFQTDKMMAGIVVIGALGYTADRLFTAAARRLLPWRDEEET